MSGWPSSSSDSRWVPARSSPWPPGRMLFTPGRRRDRDSFKPATIEELGGVVWLMVSTTCLRMQTISSRLWSTMCSRRGSKGDYRIEGVGRGDGPIAAKANARCG